MNFKRNLSVRHMCTAGWIYLDILAFRPGFQKSQVKISYEPLKTEYLKCVSFSPGWMEAMCLLWCEDEQVSAFPAMCLPALSKHWNMSFIYEFPLCCYLWSQYGFDSASQILRLGLEKLKCLEWCDLSLSCRGHLSLGVVAVPFCYVYFENQCLERSWKRRNYSVFKWLRSLSTSDTI